MALWATELGLAQVGSLVTIALFISNQFLRYWILQSQWKGFPDSETFSRPTSLSNRPGDTEVSRLSCTKSSVVFEGRRDSSMRFKKLQFTFRPAGRRAEHWQGWPVVCALGVAKRRSAAKPKPESILRDQGEKLFHICTVILSLHNNRNSEEALEDAYSAAFSKLLC